MLDANLAADFHSQACCGAFRHRSWSLTLFTCGAALNVGHKCSTNAKKSKMAAAAAFVVVCVGDIVHKT